MLRKTKIPVKEIPTPVEWILKKATGQQLEYLNSLAKSSDFILLVKLIGNFKEYNIYEVFNSSIRDARELELLRAAKRGEVAGLDALIYAAQWAHVEIKKRKELSAI